MFRAETDGVTEDPSALSAVAWLAPGLALASWAIVWASAIAAVALEVALTRSSWPGLPAAAIGAALVGIAGARFGGARAIGALVAAGAITPVAITIIVGRFYYPYFAVWFAALLGCLFAVPGRFGWSLPRQWQPPLVLWASVVALTWPVIVFREGDFPTSLVTALNRPEAGGGPLPQAATWTAHVAATQLVGILWTNWLWAQFGHREARAFIHTVAAPSVVVTVVASGLAAYQGLFALDFLTAGQWSVLHRAAGTLLDANSSGMMAALWGTAAAALALSTWSGNRLVIAAMGLAVGLLGLWWTASRTAFAAWLIGAGFTARYVWGSRLSRTQRLTGGALVFALAGLAFSLAGFFGTASRNPVERLGASIPAWTRTDLTRFARSLWERDGYGVAAVRMIQESPIVGVGIGTFRSVTRDYGNLTGFGGLPADNAQNWYRHQLAELGAFGSLGWLVWLGMAVALLLRTQGVGEHALPAGIIKGVLVAIGIVSFVGMPTQDPVLTMSFWTFMFWYVVLARPRALAAERAGNISASKWIAIWTLAIAYVAITVYVGATRLRVPVRAERGNRDYMYGFAMPELAADGGMYRWAAKRAVAVVPAESRWLELTAWVNHFDVERNPVHARIWWERELVIDTTLRTIQPVRTYIRLPDDRRRALIETWVNRTLRPADYGIPDHRELGLAVEWRFVSRPPVGATTIDARRTKPPWT